MCWVDVDCIVETICWWWLDYEYHSAHQVDQSSICGSCQKTDSRYPCLSAMKLQHTIILCLVNQNIQKQTRNKLPAETNEAANMSMGRKQKEQKETVSTLNDMFIF